MSCFPCLFFALAPQVQPSAVITPQESDFYAVDYLEPPDGAVLEVGGMDFLSDGRLVVSTRRGQVWIVEDPLDRDPKKAHFHLIAEGLCEGLGLKVDHDLIHVLQRGELSLLEDPDGDGACDMVQTIADGWGLSGNYHEFAYGLPQDRLHNFYISLNVGFWDPKWWHGKSRAPWRGWVLKIAPDGRVTPFASGFRSPCGINLSPDGELFVSDNQGDWEPVGPIYHVKPGQFYGHPASLAWTDEYQKTSTEPSDTIPPDVTRAAAAIWLPYKWSRSAGNMVWDESAGKFGPFAGQMFVSELTNGMVVRVALEKVRGEWQGACFLFRQKIGSCVRVLFAKDGTLFCGMTNRGWGGLSPAQGLARMRWTGHKPFEMHSVHLVNGGFEIRFTEPLAAKLTLSPANVELTQYHYDWHWEYGSPERGTERLAVSAVALSSDRRTLTVRAPDLAPGNCARLVLSGIASESGAPLLHDEFDYTMNQFQGGPLCTTPIARLVPPPPARESQEEGWLRLCYGDAFDRWTSSGWTLCDVELDAKDPKRFETRDGVNALVNVDGDRASDFVSKPVFGDAKLHVDFMLAEGARCRLYLQGRYALDFEAAVKDGATRSNLCGAIAKSAHFPGREAALDAWRGAGQWHAIDLYFRAPKFDAAGKKTVDARFERVFIDDILLHENIALSEPSDGGLAGEVREGPIVFRAQGPVALGGIKLKPLDAALEVPIGEGTWKPLLDKEDAEGIGGWKAVGEAEWKVEDGVLIGSKKRGWLFSPRGDYDECEVRAKVKLGAGGNSGISLRASEGPEGAIGYEGELNGSYPDKQRTGSLLDLAPIGVQLVADDTWFDWRASCVDEKNGTRVRVWVNGVLFTDYLDKSRKHGSGHIALQQHHEGSVVELKSLEIRELQIERRR